jgi:hypothetical protein
VEDEKRPFTVDRMILQFEFQILPDATSPAANKVLRGSDRFGYIGYE